jgi:transcriptional regulator with XRE-family HTH domain
MANDRARDRYQPSHIEVQFGERVAELRKANNLTQAELSALVSKSGYPLHQTTVAKLEKGLRPTSLGEASAIATILGVSLDDLLAHSTALDDAVQKRQPIMAAITRAHRLRTEQVAATDAFVAAQRDLDIALGGSGTRGVLVAEEVYPNLRFCAKQEVRLIEDLLYTSPMVLVGPGGPA